MANSQANAICAAFLSNLGNIQWIIIKSLLFLWFDSNLFSCKVIPPSKQSRAWVSSGCVNIFISAAFCLLCFANALLYIKCLHCWSLEPIHMLLRFDTLHVISASHDYHTNHCLKLKRKMHMDILANEMRPYVPITNLAITFHTYHFA